MLNRVVAFILLLSFGLFSLEALIADVHDGDASAAEVASATAATMGDSGPPVTEIGAANDSERQGAKGPVHEQHACHCVHAHGFSVNRVPSLPPLPGSRVLAISHVSRAPDQVDVLRHLRPPIA